MKSCWVLKTSCRGSHANSTTMGFSHCLFLLPTIIRAWIGEQLYLYPSDENLDCWERSSIQIKYVLIQQLHCRCHIILQSPMRAHTSRMDSRELFLHKHFSLWVHQFTPLKAWLISQNTTANHLEPLHICCQCVRTEKQFERGYPVESHHHGLCFCCPVIIGRNQGTCPQIDSCWILVNYLTVSLQVYGESQASQAHANQYGLVNGPLTAWRILPTLALPQSCMSSSQGIEFLSWCTVRLTVLDAKVKSELLRSITMATWCQN